MQAPLSTDFLAGLFQAATRPSGALAELAGEDDFQAAVSRLDVASPGAVDQSNAASLKSAAPETVSTGQTPDPGEAASTGSSTSAILGWAPGMAPAVRDPEIHALQTSDHRDTQEKGVAPVFQEQGTAGVRTPSIGRTSEDDLFVATHLVPKSDHSADDAAPPEAQQIFQKSKPPAVHDPSVTPQAHNHPDDTDIPAESTSSTIEVPEPRTVPMPALDISRNRIVGKVVGDTQASASDAFGPDPAEPGEGLERSELAKSDAAGAPNAMQLSAQTREVPVPAAIARQIPAPGVAPAAADAAVQTNTPADSHTDAQVRDSLGPLPAERDARAALGPHSTPQELSGVRKGASTSTYPDATRQAPGAVVTPLAPGTSQGTEPGVAQMPAVVDLGIPVGKIARTARPDPGAASANHAVRAVPDPTANLPSAPVAALPVSNAAIPEPVESVLAPDRPSKSETAPAMRDASPALAINHQMPGGREGGVTPTVAPQTTEQSSRGARDAVGQTVGLKSEGGTIAPTVPGHATAVQPARTVTWASAAGGGTAARGHTGNITARLPDTPGARLPDVQPPRFQPRSDAARTGSLAVELPAQSVTRLFPLPRDTALRTHSIPETATVDPLVGLTAGAVTEEAQPGTVRPAPEAPISRHVAFQLAEAARHLPDRPVEITLNPEELGRVRMTLTLSDTAMTVSLLVERGETAELLRRNIEGLAQEFRALGYRDVAFEFSGEGRGSDGQAGAQTDNPVPHTPDPAKLPDEDTPAPLRIDVSGRVDIRL